MGYTPQRKIYLLKFEDSDMEGLEVKARSAPIGRLLELQELSEKAADRTESAADTRGVFSVFADYLVSWNLEDEDGHPVAASLDGIMTQEVSFVMAIIKAWSDVLTGANADLGKDSSPGATFPEDSLPMEILSPSLAN